MGGTFRINAPRNMSIYAAKRSRQVLENTAALVSGRQGPAMPIRDRYNQPPRNLLRCN